MRIYFMGTPEFAAPTLQRLIDSKHEIVAVITQPDRAKGRGKKVVFSSIKELAVKNNIPVLQPENSREERFIEEIKNGEPDYIVVVAYGQILSAQFLAVPRYGVINIHASLLPDYRGAAPINKAIINGDTVTGITTMFVEEKMDAGDILMQQKISILPTDTCKSLSVKLSEAGADMILPTIEKLAKGELFPMPQDERLVTYSPSMKKSDGHICWNRPAASIECFTRGVYPWPGAFTFYNGNRWKIFTLSVTEMKTSEEPGTIIEVAENKIVVATADFSVIIEELQAENSRRMKIADFLKGHDITNGILT